MTLETTRPVRLVLPPPTGPLLRMPDDPGTEERAAARSAFQHVERELWGRLLAGFGIGAAVMFLLMKWGG